MYKNDDTKSNIISSIHFSIFFNYFFLPYFSCDIFFLKNKILFGSVYLRFIICYMFCVVHVFVHVYVYISCIIHTHIQFKLFNIQYSIFCSIIIIYNFYVFMFLYLWFCPMFMLTYRLHTRIKIWKRKFEIRSKTYVENYVWISYQINVEDFDIIVITSCYIIIYPDFKFLHINFTPNLKSFQKYLTPTLTIG